MLSLDQLLGAAGVFYMLLFAGVAALATCLPNRWVWKGVGLLAVSIAFALPLVRAHFNEQERHAHNRMIAERFSKLCKEKAAERIYRTVEGVDGFFIMRPRKPATVGNEYRDQYWMGDPYGHSNFEAKDPANVFLADRPGYDSPGRKITPLAGYRFIELPPPVPTTDESMRFLRIDVVARHTDKGENNISTTRYFVAKRSSRYGYDWEDISTNEDRQYWIAGGRMRIVDLETQALLAERIGYVIDLEQGRGQAGGAPWELAQRTACPPFESDLTKAKEFVAKVLKPTRGYNRD